MSNKSIQQLMNEVITELANLQDQLVAATMASRQASHRETDARNRVNDTQKKFDQLVAEIKKQATNGSDWWNQRQKVGEA